MSLKNQEKQNISLQKQQDDYSDTGEGSVKQANSINDGLMNRMGQSQSNALSTANFSEEEKQSIIKYIDELKYADKRDNALIELSRQREHFAELAPFIWHSVGTIAALLQEIVAVYPQLSPPNLDTRTSNKACNVLALLQCVASHKETRQLFLKAHIPLFLYPFLNTVSKGRPFEYLRLTSLGVIGALVKMDDSDVISFLLQTEIIPLCLRIMERGTELSQTVATFIIQKILLDEQGLNYLCQTAERFFAVSTVLNNMVQGQTEKSSSRLLKHIIRCYNRLAENPRARIALKQNIPLIVKESRLLDSLDESSKKCLRSFNDAIFSSENDAQNLNENNAFISQQQTIDTFSAYSKTSDLSSLENFRNKTPVQDIGAMNNMNFKIQNASFVPQGLPQQVLQQTQPQQQVFISRPGSTINDKAVLQTQSMPFQRMGMTSPPPMGQNFIPQGNMMGGQPGMDHQTQSMYYQQAVNGLHYQANSLYMPQPSHSAPNNFMPQLHSPSPHQQNFILQQQKQQQAQYPFQQQYGFPQQTFDPNQLNQLYGNGGAGGLGHFTGQ